MKKFKFYVPIILLLVFSTTFAQTRKGMRKSRVIDSHVATTWTNKQTGGLGLMFTPYVESDRRTNFDIRVNFKRDGATLATDFERYTTTNVPNSQNRLGIDGYPTMLASNGTVMQAKDSVNVHIRMFRKHRNKLTAFIPYISNAIPALPASMLDFSEFPNIQQTMMPTESYGSYAVKRLVVSDNMQNLQINHINQRTVDLSNATNLRSFTARNYSTQPNTLILPNSNSMRSLIYQNSQNTVAPIVNLDKQTEMTTIRIDGLVNYGATTIDVSMMPKLTTLLVSSLGLTSLNLTNNPDIGILRIGQNVNIVSPDTNNFSNGIDGIASLTKLEEIYAGGASLNTTISLDNYPALRVWSAFKSPNITYTQVTQAKPNITSFEISESPTFNMDMTLFKGLRMITLQNTALTTIDLTQITHTLPISSNNVIIGTTIANNSQLQTLTFKANQLFNGALQIVDNSALSNLSLPTIQQTTATGLYVYNNGLSTLNTSHANGTTFPNITALGVGGVNDTYTTTAVYNQRRTELTTIIVKGSKFVVDGEITALFPVAQHLEIEGDANISYTNRSHVFPRMTRVYLRPKIGSGLNTSSAQIDALIQDLSQTSVVWTTSQSNLYGGGTNIFLQRVVDLRGNCAPATRGIALDDAIARLQAKGVTLYYN